MNNFPLGQELENSPINSTGWNWSSKFTWSSTPCKQQVSLSRVCPKWLYLTHVTSFSFHKKSITWPQGHFQAEKHVFPGANLWAQVPTLKDSCANGLAFPSNATQVGFYCTNLCYCREIPHSASCSVSDLGSEHPLYRSFKSKGAFMAGFRMSLTFPVLKWCKLLKYCFLSCTANKNRASYSE